MKNKNTTVNSKRIRNSKADACLIPSCLLSDTSGTSAQSFKYDGAHFQNEKIKFEPTKS